MGLTREQRQQRQNHRAMSSWIQSVCWMLNVKVRGAQTGDNQDNQQDTCHWTSAPQPKDDDEVFRTEKDYIESLLLFTFIPPPFFSLCRGAKSRATNAKSFANCTCQFFLFDLPPLFKHSSKLVLMMPMLQLLTEQQILASFHTTKWNQTK